MELNKPLKDLTDSQVIQPYRPRPIQADPGHYPYIVERTETSVRVFLPRRKEKGGTHKGINSLQWFSTVKNKEGVSDFNKRFSELPGTNT